MQSRQNKENSLYSKLQKIICKDGYFISRHKFEEIKDYCNSQQNKSATVGVCYHCCTDDKHNITKIPTPSSEGRNRFRHWCINCSRTVYIDKSCDKCKSSTKPCGFYIQLKNENLSGYINRTYKERFGVCPDDMKVDKNKPHIIDVGILFYGANSKVTPQHRRDVLITFSKYLWYKALNKIYKKQVTTLELFLFKKYCKNKELYLYGKHKLHHLLVN
eukprot:193587_1